MLSLCVLGVALWALPLPISFKTKTQEILLISLGFWEMLKVNQRTQAKVRIAHMQETLCRSRKVSKAGRFLKGPSLFHPGLKNSVYRSLYFIRNLLESKMPLSL